MKITIDEAIAIGCKKYRDLYPKGLIPKDLEEQGVLGVTPSDSHVTLHVTYSVEGEKDPFYLFRATIDRSCGDINVEIAIDWHILESFTLNKSQSL